MENNLKVFFSDDMGISMCSFSYQYPIMLYEYICFSSWNVYFNICKSFKPSIICSHRKGGVSNDLLRFVHLIELRSPPWQLLTRARSLREGSCWLGASLNLICCLSVFCPMYNVPIKKMSPRNSDWSKSCVAILIPQQPVL